MISPESSPLRALDLLYDRLATDARYDLARPGYSAQKVSFCILLNPDGSLSAIQDERDTSGKKPLARLLTLPGQAKPPGQGLNPCFLWDNSTYLLGYKTDDEKPERTAKAFAAFRERHLALESTLADPGVAAVCAFLRAWTPVRALEHKAQLDNFAATGFGVFRVVGEHTYVHDRPAVAAHWSKTALAANPDATRGQCLITGDADQPLAQLIEPAIKGVKDAQAGGAKIISFNCDAFVSYGKDQALNSPISQSSAFRHATALNALLAGPQSRLHRVQIGDATTVFWTGAPTVTEGFLAAFLDGHTPGSEAVAQDETLRARLGTFFEVLRSGGGRAFDRLTDDASTPFYVLGLSPNAARLSVRFWHAGTLGSLVDHLRDHYEALRIVRPPGPQNPEFPAAWQLLRQTGRESKDVSPLLAGPFLRAVLTGAPYPPTLASAVIARIRADRDLSYLRASILKAFLNRNHDQTISMSLDPNRPEPAYRLGRLFAALEKTQEDALPGINATIRDRFYSAASATPSTVFPRLLRTYQHHLTKAAAERGIGLKVKRERLVQEICAGIADMPAHLGLEGQSLFALGYYHQRQAFFTKADAEVQPAA
ncbi:type I-C CRISPR-associated protein Cas8c/Csd1 [Horticoccus sp. 23ND18S-11]|uniref:type I-C CRISPR-associated protein Cas8c/Csd1 n=1 Tax=Horticoccus sp. 23ND18S-11 TaxID=3391832 RepID=UPI0039C94B6C